LSFCDFEEKAYLADIEKLIGKKIHLIFEHPYPMQIFHTDKPSKEAGRNKPRNIRGRASQHEGGFGANGGQKRRFSSNKPKRG
jgi:ATP-dependent RNA helicase RhlE